MGFYRPIEACPSQQLDVAAVDARVHAVAVVLDLVQPAITRRRIVYHARELRHGPLGRLRRHSAMLVTYSAGVRFCFRPVTF